MAVTPAAALFLLYACGRFESEPASADGGLDGSNAADVVEEPTLPDGASQPDAIADAAPHADADANLPDAAEAGCVYTGAGGGSASSSGCLNEELYKCQGVSTSLKCDCPTNGCTCGAQTLLCTTNCVISPTMRTQCGFPATH
jgi:hypothetical protein